MIELSSSWELQGCFHLSDVLVVKELKEDETAIKNDNNDSDAEHFEPVMEYSAHAIVLQPFMHPEFSSISTCCILIRLSTTRRLYIRSIVVISSAPFVDLLDKYGETVVRLQGSKLPLNSATVDQVPFYQCSSKRLLPDIECVVRFSYQSCMKPVTIKYIGVQTCLFNLNSTRGLTDIGKPTNQELINLSLLSQSPSSSQRLSSSSMLARSQKKPSLGLPLLKRVSDTNNNACKINQSSTVKGQQDITRLALEERKLKTLGQIRSFLFTSMAVDQHPDFWKKCTFILLSTLVHTFTETSELEAASLLRQFEDLKELQVPTANVDNRPSNKSSISEQNALGLTEQGPPEDTLKD